MNAQKNVELSRNVDDMGRLKSELVRVPDIFKQSWGPLVQVFSSKKQTASIEGILLKQLENQPELKVSNSDFIEELKRRNFAETSFFQDHTLNSTIHLRKELTANGKNSYTGTIPSQKGKRGRTTFTIYRDKDNIQHVAWKVDEDKAQREVNITIGNNNNLPRLSETRKIGKDYEARWEYQPPLYNPNLSHKRSVGTHSPFIDITDGSITTELINIKKERSVEVCREHWGDYLSHLKGKRTQIETFMSQRFENKTGKFTIPASELPLSDWAQFFQDGSNRTVTVYVTKVPKEGYSYSFYLEDKDGIIKYIHSNPPSGRIEASLSIKDDLIRRSVSLNKRDIVARQKESIIILDEREYLMRPRVKGEYEFTRGNRGEEMWKHITGKWEGPGLDSFSARDDSLRSLIS